jgi:hypothetical protein
MIYIIMRGLKVETDIIISMMSLVIMLRPSKLSDVIVFIRDVIIPINLWELLGGDLPPTNSSKGEILHVAFKRTKLYLVVE